jgi:hypothetical protein
MGLDAVVYKSARNMPKVGIGVTRVDELTGEVFFEGERIPQLRLEDVVAIQKRLGNVSRIETLRQEIGTLLGRDESSLLLSKVLYSGTHVGDVIGREHLDDLKEEIARLKKVETRPSELNEFIAAMEDLISAAQQEGNPITFV